MMQPEDDDLVDELTRGAEAEIRDLVDGIRKSRMTVGRNETTANGALALVLMPQLAALLPTALDLLADHLPDVGAVAPQTRIAELERALAEAAKDKVALSRALEAAMGGAVTVVGPNDDRAHTAHYKPSDFEPKEGT